MVPETEIISATFIGGSRYLLDCNRTWFTPSHETRDTVSQEALPYSRASSWTNLHMQAPIFQPEGAYWASGPINPNLHGTIPAPQPCDPFSRKGQGNHPLKPAAEMNWTHVPLASAESANFVYPTALTVGCSYGHPELYSYYSRSIVQRYHLEPELSKGWPGRLISRLGDRKRLGGCTSATLVPESRNGIVSLLALWWGWS